VRRSVRPRHRHDDAANEQAKTNETHRHSTLRNTTGAQHRANMEKKV
jgi:hypothetical protein